MANPRKSTVRFVQSQEPHYGYSVDASKTGFLQLYDPKQGRLLYDVHHYHRPLDLTCCKQDKEWGEYILCVKRDVPKVVYMNKMVILIPNVPMFLANVKKNVLPTDLQVAIS